MKFLPITMIALIVAISSPAAAYIIKGNVQCSDIVEEDAHEYYREYNKWWLMGYVTARNYAASQNVGITLESDVIYTMALDYCKTHPSNSWNDAAIDIYDILD